jgi:hypothetical protein
MINSSGTTVSLEKLHRVSGVLIVECLNRCICSGIARLFLSEIINFKKSLFFIEVPHIWLHNLKFVEHTKYVHFIILLAMNCPADGTLLSFFVIIIIIIIIMCHAIPLITTWIWF